MKKEFQNSRLLKATKSPDEWISELESKIHDIIERTQNPKKKLDDDDIVLHVLNNLPSEYDTIVDGFESRLNIEDETATLNDL